FGWSRERAVEYTGAHVPMPREFMATEIDRYVVLPGQALSYLTGKLEILRLRAEARLRLGSAFDLPGFHAAVLDHGSLPMPVLATAITPWLDDQTRGHSPSLALTFPRPCSVLAPHPVPVRGRKQEVPGVQHAAEERHERGGEQQVQAGVRAQGQGD